MENIDPQYRTSDGSALRMWRDALPNNFLSEREGRPIFDEVILVEVISPGSRDSSPVFELQRKYAKEMGIDAINYGPKYEELKQYVKAFEADETSGEFAGTPLSEWPPISKSFAATLRAVKVFTVEGLANLADGRLNAVGPDGRAWRDKALGYLESTKGEGYSASMTVEIGNLKNDNAALTGQVASLAGQITALQATSVDATVLATAQIDLGTAKARITELETENAGLKVQVAKFDGDGNGTVGGKKPTMPPTTPATGANKSII